MLSRLLEAGPTQFSAPLGFMVSAVSASSAPLYAATPVLLDSTASASTGLSTLTCIQTSQRSVHWLNLLVSLISPALKQENIRPLFCWPFQTYNVTATSVKGEGDREMFAKTKENKNSDSD